MIEQKPRRTTKHVCIYFFCPVVAGLLNEEKDTLLHSTRLTGEGKNVSHHLSDSIPYYTYKPNGCAALPKRSPRAFLLLRSYSGGAVFCRPVVTRVTCVMMCTTVFLFFCRATKREAERQQEMKAKPPS